MVRPEVSGIVSNSHWRRTLPPTVTLMDLIGVLTVISSTRPAKQQARQVPGKSKTKPNVLKCPRSGGRSREVVTYDAGKHHQAQHGGHHLSQKVGAKSFFWTDLSTVFTAVFQGSTESGNEKTILYHRQGYSMRNGLILRALITQCLHMHVCQTGCVLFFKNCPFGR